MEDFKVDEDELEHLLEDTSIDNFAHKLESTWINRSTVRVTINNDFVGAIIGKKGKNISQIRKFSNAMIELRESRSPMDNSPCRFKTITINGDRSSVDRALFLLHICLNMFNTHPDDVSFASLLDAVHHWRQTRLNNTAMHDQFTRIDSNQNVESGYGSRAHFSAPKPVTYSRADLYRIRNNSGFEETKPNEFTYSAGRNIMQPSVEPSSIHQSNDHTRVSPTSELKLSEFSVQNREVPHLNQEDFGISELTITEHHESPTVESADQMPQVKLGPEQALDEFLLELQRVFAGGITLGYLNIILTQTDEYKSRIDPFLYQSIINLQTYATTNSLFELVKNNKEYVYITAEGYLHVRFSKHRRDSDFEAIMIEELETPEVEDLKKSQSPLNANDKISMAVEEYAIRMASVFKDNASVVSFTSEDFTEELSGDSYASTIVSFLHEYLQYYQNLRNSGNGIEETSEFYVLQENITALTIHQLHEIDPIQLVRDGTRKKVMLWKMVADEGSMYSEFFKFENDSISLRDRKLLQIMCLKDNEQIVSRAEFGNWHRLLGMTLFEDNLQSRKLTNDDELNEDCFFYEHVRIKYVESCVEGSIAIHNQNADQMKNELAEEIDAFLEENVCDLAKGRDGFKAAGLFPYLVEGREHLIRPGQLLIYNGTYKERCYVMKAEEDDLSNISNQNRSYFARHSPSSIERRTRRNRRSREVPEFENSCKNVRVYYLDYGYEEKVPVSDLYFASPKFLQWPVLAMPVALYNHIIETEENSYGYHHKQCIEAARRNLKCDAFDFWERRERKGEIFRLRFVENEIPDWNSSSRSPPKVLLMEEKYCLELLQSSSIDRPKAWVNRRATKGDNHTISLQNSRD